MGIYLGGVSQIVAADVSGTERWIALAFLLVIIQSLVIAMLAFFVAARDPATRILQKLHGWLIEHNRVISIVLGLVIGAWFLVKGISQTA